MRAHELLEMSIIKWKYKMIDTKKINLEFRDENGLKNIVLKLEEYITKFKKDKKISMYDLLNMNYVTTNMLMQQIIKMNVVMDENFDPENDDSELLQTCEEYTNLCMYLKNTGNLLEEDGSIKDTSNISDEDMIKSLMGIEDDELIKEILDSPGMRENLKDARKMMKEQNELPK